MQTDKNVVPSHCKVNIAMANIRFSMEKSRQKQDSMQVIPFEEYLNGITDTTERRMLFDKLKSSIGILSDSTLWRYRSGGIRPNILQRKEMASVIRRHSGDRSWTGDNLFPAEYYK